jgi:hypothetical protein
MTTIIDHLNEIWRDGDHKRGCQGREYICTCGVDDRTFLTAKEAIAEIENMKAEIKRLREVLEECAEHFYDRSDADCEDGRFIPNKEMILLDVVKRALGEK